MGSQFAGQAATAASIALLTCLVPALAGAQAIVRGTLYDDSTGTPIRGAVMLVDPTTDAPVVNTHADSLGQFNLQVRDGVYQIAAVRDGYKSTLSAPLTLASGERMTILLPMNTRIDPRHKIMVVNHVKPAHVERKDNASVMGGFYARRAVGIGLHYDRAQLEQSQAQTVGQFLEQVPGLSVDDPTMSSSMSLMRNMAMQLSTTTTAAPAGTCKLGWFLDGRRIDLPGQNDALTDGLSQISLDHVAGIEVFRGLSEMPGEFAEPDLQCGAIAIWSRMQ